MENRSSQVLTVQRIPWKLRILIFIFDFFLDASRRKDGTLNRRLLALFDVKCRPNPKPRRGISTYDVTVDPSRGLGARLFLPTSKTPSFTRYPVVVYFHGGGFALFSSSSKLYDDYCRRLARKISAIIISVDNRRAPEHRFPANHEDGLDVLRFLDAEGGGSKDAGSENLFRIANLSNCFIAGDSAGGNIAHHVTRRWCGEESSRTGRLHVSGLIPIQPFFGGQEEVESEVRLAGAPMVNLERTEWLWKAFLPEGSDRDHHACNVFGLGSKATKLEEELGNGFPPVFVVVGTADPMMDRQLSYAEGLRERGKEVTVKEFPTAIHGFFMFPEVPQSTVLIEEIRTFVHPSVYGSHRGN